MLRRQPAQRRDRVPLPLGVGMLVAAALVAAPLAVAATGDTLREGVRNGTAVEETRIIGDVDATPTGRGGYVLRESNVATGRRAGGASFMSCNAPKGGTARGSAPCLRTDNLARGNAFEFSSKGALAGLITLGDPTVPNPGKPFATNATGVATGLNADKVDGKDAADLAGAPDVVFAERQRTERFEDCGEDLLACPNLLTMSLKTRPPAPSEGPPRPASEIPPRNWLVQAKLVIHSEDRPDEERTNCGLVIDGGTDPSAVLDSANSMLADIAFTPGETETLALSAVISEQLRDPTIALRCSEGEFNDTEANKLKMTALEVGNVTEG